MKTLYYESGIMKWYWIFDPSPLKRWWRHFWTTPGLIWPLFSIYDDDLSFWSKHTQYSLIAIQKICTSRFFLDKSLGLIWIFQHSRPNSRINQQRHPHSSDSSDWYSWNGPQPHLGPWLFWSLRILGPTKVGPCMKMLYNDFHADMKFLGAQTSWGWNFSRTKFLGDQKSQGPKWGRGPFQL